MNIRKHLRTVQFGHWIMLAELSDAAEGIVDSTWDTRDEAEAVARSLNRLGIPAKVIVFPSCCRIAIEEAR